MKVWIATLFDNLPHEGFRRQRYWLMAQAFADAGHEVVYWTGDFNHGTKDRRQLNRPSEAGIELKVLPVMPYPRNICIQRAVSHLAFARRLNEAMSRMIAPDLVIAAAPPPSAAYQAMRAAHRHGAKFIVDIQDLWPETFVRIVPPLFKFFSPLFLAPMFKTARRLYRQADGVSGVSGRYRAASGRSDYYLARLGIARDSGEPTGRKGKSGRKKLVYAGNLGHGYDLETVINAVKLDPSLTLDIAGGGPKERCILELVEKLNLKDRVQMHGYLSDVRLKALLASCDVGVIPMRDDSWVGIPNKLCDYLQAGLPVISSLHGECGDVLRTEKLGSVYEYGSAQSLLGSLGELGDDPITFPPQFDAAEIYPKYVKWALSL